MVRSCQPIKHADAYNVCRRVEWECVVVCEGNSRHLLCSGSRMPLQLIPTQRPFREMVRFAEVAPVTSRGHFFFRVLHQERGKPYAIVAVDHTPA